MTNGLFLLFLWTTIKLTYTLSLLVSAFFDEVSSFPHIDLAPWKKYAYCLFYYFFFLHQFLGAFLLLIVLLAVLDKRNGPPPAGLVPLVLFLVFLALGFCFGAQTGFAVNPARDLGPRILTAMAGYGREVFNFRHQYWLWCGVLAPILGALTATFVYDTFVYTGGESKLNRRT